MERLDVLAAFRRRLASPDQEVARAAARAWTGYEVACCTLTPNPDFADLFQRDEHLLSMATVETHYLSTCRFEPEDRLLRDIDEIRGIPTFVVHGRYDLICPVKNAHDLQGRWPEADVVIVADAGHSSHEPEITRQLVSALQRVRETGSPTRR